MAGAPSDPSIPADRTAMFDPPLHALGFEYSSLSPEKVTGILRVTESCCQPFKVLHGGVAACLAEGVASTGSYIASGFQRIAAVQLSTNYLKSAHLGDLVLVEGMCVHHGRTTQLWEVQQWRINPSNSGEKELLSSTRVTLLCNLPSPKEMKGFADAVKTYAKL